MIREDKFERAVFLHRMDGPLPSGYSRLYFGSEFCARAFPPLSEVRDALGAARQAGWAFTLALPVLSESFLPPLRSVLQEVLPLFLPGDEVMISDLGEIAPVREISPDVTVTVGRVLSGQKRGPQILGMSLTETQLAYFRQGSWYAAEAVAFLREKGIARVELDNLLQGIGPLPAGLAGSLHVPYAMVTSSRNCPHRETGSAGCVLSCGEVFTLSSPASPLPLIQGGNTQFLLNERLPENVGNLGIDRVVRHPVLPR